MIILTDIKSIYVVSILKDITARFYDGARALITIIVLCITAGGPNARRDVAKRRLRFRISSVYT